MTHLLFIDDEAEIREILSQALTAYGYRVTAAASAEEALQVVRNDRPDVVVTDLQLEETDGFAVIDAVKAIAPQTPVILLTGVLFDAGTIEKIGAGKVSGYIQKTASLDQIRAEIQRHIP
jgi:two-component system response regulator GlrR